MLRSYCLRCGAGGTPADRNAFGAEQAGRLRSQLLAIVSDRERAARNAFDVQAGRLRSQLFAFVNDGRHADLHAFGEEQAGRLRSQLLAILNDGRHAITAPSMRSRRGAAYGSVFGDSAAGSGSAQRASSASAAM